MCGKQRGMLGALLHGVFVHRDGAKVPGHPRRHETGGRKIAEAASKNSAVNFREEVVQNVPRWVFVNSLTSTLALSLRNDTTRYRLQDS